MIPPVSSCEYCDRFLGAARFICSQCFKVSYCDIDCQRSHWKHHKKVCKIEQMPLSPTMLKAQTVAESQSLLPAKAPRSDEMDEKEALSFSLTSAVFREALADKQARWADKHSIREHLRTHIWPSQAQNWKELEYTLKPDLDIFFADKVKLKALDLGAGSCNNVSVLIDVGFVYVTAVDNFANFETIAQETVQTLKSAADEDLLEVVLLEKSITSKDLEIFPRDESLGAIIARRVFELCAPDDFEHLLIASYASLEKGGCFIVSVNLLDSTKPNLYDRYWKGGEWGFANQSEVNAAENFLKSLGFTVQRLNIDYGPNHPEVLFFCQKNP